ncbi:MAG: hypothetical protein ACK40H_10070 [Sphingomonadaceae bacterium]
MTDAAAASRAASAGASLHPGQLDHLGKALLALARELWVTRDRLMVLEAVLEARGIPVSQAIADFQPDAALAARLAAERDALARAIVETLAPETGA